MKIKEPKVLNLIEYNLKDACYENNFYGFIFNENVRDIIHINDITIDSCVFKNIDFSNIEISKVDLVDVIFENCDLSNKVFDYKQPF